MDFCVFDTGFVGYDVLRAFKSAVPLVVLGGIGDRWNAWKLSFWNAWKLIWGMHVGGWDAASFNLGFCC